MALIETKAKYQTGTKAVLRSTGEYLLDVTPGGVSGGAYRGRTGPRCCNDGCPSGRRKGGRFIRRATGE